MTKVWIVTEANSIDKKILKAFRAEEHMNNWFMLEAEEIMKYELEIEIEVTMQKALNILHYEYDITVMELD